MAGQQELAVALELLGDHKHLQRTKAVEILTGLFKGWFPAGAWAELHAWMPASAIMISGSCIRHR
jgi:hypothetical protein